MTGCVLGLGRLIRRHRWCRQGGPRRTSVSANADSASAPSRAPARGGKTRRLGRISLASLGAVLFTVSACGGNGSPAASGSKGGGATDVGVTPDSINIVAIDDVT